MSDKVALYSVINFTTLLGRDVSNNNKVEMVLRFRNEYPRFNVITSTDTSIPYFDRVKTIQMNTQMMQSLAMGIKELLRSGKNRTIIVRYPDFQNNPDELKVIATFSIYDNNREIVIGVNIDDTLYEFPLKADNTFFSIMDGDKDITTNRENNLEVANLYADNLLKAVMIYPLLYSIKVGNEVEVKVKPTKEEPLAMDNEVPF